MTAKGNEVRRQCAVNLAVVISKITRAGIHRLFDCVTVIRILKS